MKIEPINPPETVTEQGITVTLTHKCTSARINPADPVYPVVVNETKGFMVDGQYRDWGPHVSNTMDQEGYAALLAKNSGEIKLSELKPAIDKRQADLKKEREDKEAADTRAREKADAQAAAGADAFAKKTTVSPNAKPAGPDAVAT